MRRKGTFWIVTGLLLIAAALCLTFYNLTDDARAGTKAVEIMEELLPEVIEKKPDTPAPVITEMPEREIDGKTYVAIVSIDKLGLELPVFSTWDYTKLQSAPCRFYGSAYTGDLVICAHNYNRHFGQIKNLVLGDSVVIVDMDGGVYRYEVSEIETLGPMEIERMLDSSGWDLTLFTCTLGGRTRVTVRCRLTA